MHSDPEKRKAWHKAYQAGRRASFAPHLICELEGCDKLVDEWNKRICQMHRKRMRRTGTYQLLVRLPTPKTARLPKVPTVRSPIDCADGCGRLVAHGRCKPCNDRHLRLAAAARRRAMRQPVRKTCLGCSIVFETMRADRVYHSHACAKHRGNGSKERKKAENRVRKLRFLLWQRDTKCYGCGHEIDYSLKTPHQWSPEVDHLTPLSMGGRTELDNLAVMHRQCNADKSDRDAGSWERTALAAMRAEACHA
jgi:hypothetical protein